MEGKCFTGTPIKKHGGKNTALTNCAVIAKVVFVGHIQVSGCTVKHRVPLSQRCAAQCDHKTKKNAPKNLGLATCLLQAQRSQLKILKNSVQLSETHVFFSLFFTPPLEVFDCVVETDSRPQWRRTAPNSLLRRSKSRRWRGQTHPACLSEGRRKKVQGGIGHKVKRKVRLEQMTCVLLMEARERERGEGEGEKKHNYFALFVSKVREAGHRHGNKQSPCVSLSRQLSGCCFARPGVYFHDMR